jgi:hypothetical protein
MREMSDLDKAREAIRKNLFSTLDSQMGRVFTAGQCIELADDIIAIVRAVIAEQKPVDSIIAHCKHGFTFERGCAACINDRLESERASSTDHGFKFID